MTCSSAHERTATLAQQSAALCFAVLCRSFPCCVLCCTFTSSCMPVTCGVSYNVPVLLIFYTPGLYISRYCWITNNATPAQVSPVMYSPVAQRIAVRCRALPFVLRCWTCGAVRSFFIKFEQRQLSVRPIEWLFLHI